MAHDGAQSRLDVLLSKTTEPNSILQQLEVLSIAISDPLEFKESADVLYDFLDPGYNITVDGDPRSLNREESIELVQTVASWVNFRSYISNTSSTVNQDNGSATVWVAGRIAKPRDVMLDCEAVAMLEWTWRKSKWTCLRSVVVYGSSV